MEQSEIDAPGNATAELRRLKQEHTEMLELLREVASVDPGLAGCPGCEMPEEDKACGHAQARALLQRIEWKEPTHG